MIDFLFKKKGRGMHIFQGFEFNISLLAFKKKMNKISRIQLKETIFNEQKLTMILLYYSFVCTPY